MRILHVHGSYYREGGAETYLRSLIEAQQACGHEPAILYADRAPAAEHPPCPVYWCPPSHGLRSGMRALPAYRKAVADFVPDLIHLHVVQYQVSPVVLSWLVKVAPTVMTVHDTLTLCPKPVTGQSRVLSARILPDGTPCTQAMGMACLTAGCLTALLRSAGLRTVAVALGEKLWRRRLYRRVNRLVVNSAFTQADLIRNGIPATAIDVLPVPPEIPGEWNASGQEQETLPRLLFVGQLSLLKGAVDFIAVLRQLEDLPWRASMVGDGPERPRVEAELSAAGLGERVSLHGYVPRKEMARYYRGATALVLPTLAPESLGLVGIEALWFGTPVVAYDVGAIREWLRDGSNGFLCHPGDTAQMASGLRALLTDAPQRQQLRQQAGASARQWLAACSFPTAFNELYRQIREGKPC